MLHLGSCARFLLTVGGSVFQPVDNGVDLVGSIQGWRVPGIGKLHYVGMRQLVQHPVQQAFRQEVGVHPAQDKYRALNAHPVFPEIEIHHVPVAAPISVGDIRIKASL